MHIRLAGSGVHIPLDDQVAVIHVAGTNIGLHLNDTSAQVKVVSTTFMQCMAPNVEC